MPRLIRRRCLPVGLAAVAALALTAAPGPEARAADPDSKEQLEKDQKLVQGLLNKLVAEMDRPDGWDSWPPALVVEDKRDGRGRRTINANAGPADKDWPRKWHPQVTVYTGFIHDLCHGDERLMALTLAHELGHIARQHARRTIEARGKLGLGEYEGRLLELVYSREYEEEADNFGADLMLKAGFTTKDLTANLVAWFDLYQTGRIRDSSPEGLDSTHPSWDDDRVRIDKNNVKLWRALRTFQSGLFFLEVEHYANAARSFQQVVDESDQRCYEAYANLGYAELMDYCDQLDAKDLRKFDVGHLVAGAFYDRSDYLGKLVPRGENAALWKEAVKALEAALRLRPDLRLARANLGLAYLLRPTTEGGKDTATALRYLNEALGRKGEELPARVWAALLCNKAVAQFAAGKKEDAARTLDAFAQMARKAGGLPELTRALNYNRALMLAGSAEGGAREQAVGLFEGYLNTTPPAETWWALAYDRYRQLGADLNQPVKERKDLAAPHGELRQAVSVKTAKGVEVRLADSPEDLAAALGKPEAVIPAIPGSMLRRQHFPGHGLVLLTTKDQVVAIILKGENAPPLELRERGTGGVRHTLKVGMTAGELERTLGQAKHNLELGGEDASPRFYPEVGVGALIRGGRVRELFVARAPRPQARND